MKRINRRGLLKTGLISAGGLLTLPQFSLGELPRAGLQTNQSGDFIYSPFFREYNPQVALERPKLIAKLNANENPHGPSPKTVEALKAAASKGNRYGWRELSDLVAKIASKEGVKAENVIMGPGSSDLLEKTGMVMFLNGGNVVSADPSYMSLIRVAEATGASWKGVPLKDDWSHDLKAMKKAIDKKTKLVYICNPNNPTGTITDHKQLRKFCSKVSEKVPVFVDEAYLEFMDDSKGKSMVSLVQEGKNVIVARTFSKIHGMAGLRVGYALAQEKTLKQIQKITRAGMGITQTSIDAALASMDDAAFLEKSKKLNAKSREFVYESLEAMGKSYVKSNTSFIIFPIEMEGKTFLEKMYAKGVGVRAFEIKGGNWCRVSMGTLDEMKIFVSALKDVTS